MFETLTAELLELSADAKGPGRATFAVTTSCCSCCCCCCRKVM